MEDRVGESLWEPQMTRMVRQVLGFQLTVAELISIRLLVGTPYLLIGAIWPATHTQHLSRMHGIDLAVSFLGSVVFWPALLFSNVCMT
jgi:hypothetical protein